MTRRYLGDSASIVYGQSSSASVNTLVPRNKFQFKVELQYIDVANPTTYKILSLDRIADIQMPSHNPKTQIINQYNKKRIIQMGVEYVPIMLTAYDTRDAEIENFLIDYNKHYFASPMSDDIKKMEDDIVPTSDNGYSGKGFQLTETRYFIKQIAIIRNSSEQDMNTIEIYNPVISSIQTDTLSYSESAPVQYRIEFSYEGYNTSTIDSHTQGP